MKNEDILELNKKGFIPAVDEDEKAFLKRVSSTFNIGLKLPFTKEDVIPAEHKKSAAKIVQDLFDVAPLWVPAYYHNHSLAPWHAANCWVISEEGESSVSLIQLRKIFKSKMTFFKVYHRDEVIAHEMAHIGRAGFQNSKYEEIIAYQTSKEMFRKFVGPVLSSILETWLFIVSVLVVLVLDLFFVIKPSLDLIPFITVAQLVPWFVLGSLIVRLGWRQYKYKKCFQNIVGALRSEKKARAVIYRLTDQEIEAIANKKKDVMEYSRQNKSLRWQFISLSYLTTL
jgi:hypothetical protein